MWWLSDSNGFYQWSLVIVTGIYTHRFHYSISKLAQSIKVSDTHIYFRRRYGLTMMDWIFWCYLTYHCNVLWDLSTFSSMSVALFCGALLFSVAVRAFIPTGFKLARHQEVGIFKDRCVVAEDWDRYKVFERQDKNWGYLGPVYVDLNKGDTLLESLTSQDLTIIEGTSMHKNNAWYNTKLAMLGLAASCFFFFVLPDILDFMIRVGPYTHKGMNLYRTQAQKDFLVGVLSLFWVIPGCLGMLYLSFKSSVEAFKGGEKSIIFAGNSVMLSNRNKDGQISINLCLSRLKHIKWPRKRSKKKSVWDKAILDTSLQLIDIDGNVIELYDWHFGSTHILNHFVRLGLPVWLYDYQEEKS
ncbi:hypothetical protein [Vibrio mexicanus]|uniref:hypothetical protein n=1 Tax=Vibrio mexicanus TaxID=1004326 RepID=UPI0012FA17EF|nr:hypothetical protein [Vibrio mexicanus]